MAPADLFERIIETKEFLRSQGVGEVDIGGILGSGMSGVADIIEDPLILPYAEIPHWGVTGVTGHSGNIHYGRVGKKNVLLCSGRLHYYEGYPLWQVAYAMRILKALAASIAVTTGAAGGVNPEYEPGSLVLIHDHINYLPDNPLRGPHNPRLGVRFPDMSQPYDAALRYRVLRYAARAGFSMQEGIYAAVPGPNLETQAEYAWLARTGADMVGMSVVPDAIVAAQSELPLLGIGVISNVYSETPSAQRTTVEDVIRIVNRSSDKLAQVLQSLCV